MRKLLACCLAAFSGLTLGAETWRQIDYADMMRMPLLLRKVDTGHVFRSGFLVKPGEGRTSLPAGLRIDVVVDGEAVPLTMDAAGKLALPLRDEWVEREAQVRINQPKGTVVLSFDMRPRIPAGTRIPYATMAESVPVFERGIAEMGGLARLFGPKVKAFLLSFPAGTTATAALTWPDGRTRRWTADGQGLVELPWRRDWSGATVELSAPLADFDIRVD